MSSCPGSGIRFWPHPSESHFPSPVGLRIHSLAMPARGAGGFELDIKVQETYKTPNREGQKGSPPPRIHSNQNIKFTEQREDTKNLRGKDQVMYRYIFIILTPNFSVETLKVGRTWMDVQQNLRDHRWQPRLLYPVKLSVTPDGERKTFYDRKKLKQFLSEEVNHIKLKQRLNNPQLIKIP